jgi:hypothetical protein
MVVSFLSPSSETFKPKKSTATPVGLEGLLGDSLTPLHLEAGRFVPVRFCVTIHLQTPLSIDAEEPAFF